MVQEPTIPSNQATHSMAPLRLAFDVDLR